MTENKKIEILSDDVKEILTSIPPWLMRSGFSLLIFLFIIFIFMSFMFKYSDVITFKLKIRYQIPTYPVVAHISGNVQQIFVENNQSVENGQLIGIISNSANYEDICTLRKLTDKYTFQNIHENIELFLKNFSQSNLSLGEVNHSYTSFINSAQNFSIFSTTNSLIKNKELIKSEQSLQEESCRLIETLIILQSNRITEDTSSLDTILLNNMDFTSNRIIDQLIHTKLNLLQTKINIKQLEKNINDIESNFIKQELLLKYNLQTSFLQLKEQLTKWEKNYLLKTNISGTIIFMSNLQELSPVVTGQVISNILPSNRGEIIGISILDATQIEKLKVGQKVNIKLDAYPQVNEEFPAYISNISNSNDIISVYESSSLFNFENNKIDNTSTQSNNSYIVKYCFPNGLVTQNGNKINLLFELTGTAKIVTDETSLFQRIFSPLIVLLKNTKGL